MKSKITTSVATMTKVNDFTIKVDYFNEIDVELKEAIEVHQAFKELSPSHPICILIDGRKKFVNYSAEAKEFYAKDKEYAPEKVAVAIVINSLPARIIAKFYFSFHHPYYKTRICSNKESGLKWLEDMYREYESKKG